MDSRGLGLEGRSGGFVSETPPGGYPIGKTWVCQSCSAMGTQSCHSHSCSLNLMGCGCSSPSSLLVFEGCHKSNNSPLVTFALSLLFISLKRT